MAKRYGDPLIAVRMPRHLIAALKMMARDQGSNSSEIIRALVEAELRAHGYKITEEPLEGQMRLE